VKTETDKPLTWTALVRAAPKLADLLAGARATDRAIWATCEDRQVRLDRYHAGDRYRDEIRPALPRLVGWHRRSGPALLETREAYDLARRVIRGALPADVTDAEIAEALDEAHSRDFDEGQALALAGPAAS
jgi:hypothetical protein